MALLVTFLICSSVSSTVFRMFGCETQDGGREYLRADYTIQCTSGKHKAAQVGCAGDVVGAHCRTRGVGVDRVKFEFIFYGTLYALMLLSAL